MEPNFDLDINNYTANDLLNFFKLDDNFSFDDLDTRENDIITEITNKNTNYTSKYKFDIISDIFPDNICFDLIFPPKSAIKLESKLNFKVR